MGSVAREATRHWPLLPRLAYCTAYLRLDVLPGIIMVTPKADHAYTEHKSDKLNLPRIDTRRPVRANNAIDRKYYVISV